MDEDCMSEDVDESEPYLPWIDDELEPAWKADVPTASLALDWATRGDEFLHRLGDAAAASSWTMSSRGGTKKHPGVIFSPADNDRQQTCLWLQGRQRGFRATVWGSGKRDQSLVKHWSAVVNDAYRRVAESERLEWTAAIRCVDQVQRLSSSAPYNLGDIWIESAVIKFVEYRKRPTSTQTATITEAYPIIVRGRDNGVEGNPRVSDNAKSRVRLLCALLTVAWNAPWLLMEEPCPSEYWVDLPTTSHFDKFIDSRAANASVDEVELPSWLPDALVAIHGDVALKQALLMYHEAVILDEQHPSVSLVCLTSAVEALASRDLGAVPKCDSCHQVMGATARFKATLLKVLSPKEASDASTAYGRRSETVHSGKMHGGEVGFDSMLSDFHLPNNSVDFWTLRGRLSSAVRELLIQEFKSTIDAE